MAGRLSILPIFKSRRGATLVEIIVSTAAASVVLAAVGAGALSIQRAISTTDQFLINTSAQTRMLDYLSQDLRRAVRVGMQVDGVAAPFRMQQGFSITATNVLTIDVPDYYASNIPENAIGSLYKTTRYARPALNTAAAFNPGTNPRLNGVIPWAEASILVNRRQLPRFKPPAEGDGTIQVRYFQATRGTNPPITSFYRAEYPSGAATASEVREIADSVSRVTSTAIVTVSGLNDGKSFRITSQFTPRYRIAATAAATTPAQIDVSLRNARRD